MTESPQRWRPNTTVAAVVPRGSTFLMVEERCRDSGGIVFNQPAGHLEAGERLIDAVTREVLEETRWRVLVEAYLGVARFPAENGVTYMRHTFLATPIEEIAAVQLDAGIIRAHWMTRAEISALGDRLRSPNILRTVDLFLGGQQASLDIVLEP